MDEALLDRLTLVTLFNGRETIRTVSAYVDVRWRLPEISYERPIGQVGDATIVIKPFREANAEERASL